MMVSLLLAAASVHSPGKSVSSSPQGPTYTVRLEVAEPERARFTMRLPSKEGLLSTSSTSEPMLVPPTCAHIPLKLVSVDKWLKPSGCKEVSWTATVPNLGERSFDASRPGTFWSAQRQLWFLSGDLPWLRYEQQPWAMVHVIANTKTGLIEEEIGLPADLDSPVYILVGRPKRLYHVGRVTTAIYGDIPARANADRFQHIVAATLARWSADLLPNDAPKRGRFNYLWIAASNGAAPGLFASTGSDAILMQFVPDPTDRYPYAKLDAGILLTEAHEGFHALAGVLSDGKPTWINESWASYFAYATARRVLTGPASTIAKQLFDEPADVSVLRAQALVDGGDGSHYEVFYTRAARFWAAIDSVLTDPPNNSGRLAALLKETHGMQGVDWRDPASITAFLDPRTAGRAQRIVQCYLVEDRCPESNVGSSQLKHTVK